MALASLAWMLGKLEGQEACRLEGVVEEEVLALEWAMGCRPPSSPSMKAFRDQWSWSGVSGCQQAAPERYLGLERFMHKMEINIRSREAEQGQHTVLGRSHGSRNVVSRGTVSQRRTLDSSACQCEEVRHVISAPRIPMLLAQVTPDVTLYVDERYGARYRHSYLGIDCQASSTPSLALASPKRT